MILFVVLLFVVGTIGYRNLLNVNWIDALYMTIITISTVGYGEVAPLTTDGKIFSILLILFSMAIIGYGITTLASFIFEGNMREVWRKRKMKERIEKMNNHYIVCGAGKTGSYVIEELIEKGEDFIVVERESDVVEQLMARDIPVILADATTDEALINANVKKAKGLVSALSSDADNLFTVLTVRELNEKITIVSKALDRRSNDKILRAGANKTVLPDEIGGRRMVSMLLRPSVMAFLDTITYAGEIELDLEEIQILTGSNLIDQSLRTAQIPEKTGLIVIAIEKKQDGKMIFNPSSAEILKDKDTLIVLGKQEQVNKLSDIASGDRSVKTIKRGRE